MASEVPVHYLIPVYTAGGGILARDKARILPGGGFLLEEVNRRLAGRSLRLREQSFGQTGHSGHSVSGILFHPEDRVTERARAQNDPRGTPGCTHSRHAVPSTGAPGGIWAVYRVVHGGVRWQGGTGRVQAGQGTPPE